MVTNNYLSAPELSGTDCAIWTYPVVHEPSPRPQPVYKCDLFGDGVALVFYYYDQNKVPSWFRRLCTTLVIGTKWTKL